MTANPIEDALRAERDAAEAEVTRLREALMIYANKDEWAMIYPSGHHIMFFGNGDGWEIARKALGKGVE